MLLKLEPDGALGSLHVHYIQKVAEKTNKFSCNLYFQLSACLEKELAAEWPHGESTIPWWKTRQRENKFTETRDSSYTSKKENDIIDKQEFLNGELNLWKENITDDPEDY